MKNNEKISEKELKELKKLDNGWFPDSCLMYRTTKFWEARGLTREKAVVRAADGLEKLSLISHDVVKVMIWMWTELSMSDYVDETMEEKYKESPLMENKTFLKCLELLKHSIES